MCINTGQEVLKKSESDSSVVPNERTRGNEHKLKHKKLKKSLVVFFLGLVCFECGQTLEVTSRRLWHFHPWSWSR